jgi:formate dehydrogenase iron-sulfur subunit
MCVDRISNGMEPACVKACPTSAIRFGTKEDMTHYGTEKVGKLKERGFDDALLYDPEGVKGLHMMYVVPRGEMLDEYGLPEEPTVKGASFFPAMSGLRKLGSVATWAGLIGAGIFFLRTGRRLPPSEDKAVASAQEKGRASERQAQLSEEEKSKGGESA